MAQGPVVQVKSAYQDTEIGPIPADWDVVPLGEIADVQYGKARPKTEGNVPVVGSGGIYAWANEALVDYPTLVVGRKGSAGSVWFMESPCWPSDTTFYLEWKKQVDVKFVFGCLAVNPLSGEQAKTTLPSLQRPQLENYLIPLPPLPEQRRIAHVLSTIQRAIEVQDRVIAGARELKRSLMQRLFTYGPGAEPAPTKETEIGEVPAHWEVVGLGEAGEVIMGQSPRGDTYNEDAVGVPLINGPAEFGERFPVGYKWTTEPTKTCRIGDILFCVRGNTTGRMNFADWVYCIGRGVAAIRGAPQLSETLFVYYFLEMREQAILSQATAGGSTFPNITKGELNALAIPLPSLPEQHEIASALSAVDRKIEVEENRKAALQALFKSMLHQLMTGQIRVQDLEWQHAPA